MNIKYFTCANSCKGFVNLTENNIEGIKRIYSIKSSSAKGISAFIKQRGDYFESRNNRVEYILNSSNKDLFDGCIMRNIDVCFLNNKIYAGGKEIDLGSHNDFSQLENKIQKCYERMYEAFCEAKKIHDDWEQIYIQNMDFEKLNLFKKKSIEEMFGENKADSTSKVFQRFFGGSTKSGYVNLIDELTQCIPKRYFIKGRPGSGKSTFMKEVAKKAVELGFDADIYKCSFDPDSLDMVVVSGANFCVFDSTAPHEMFPTQIGDRVLDFYKESGLIGVDEKYKSELKQISAEYKLRINEGNEHLRLASLLEDELEGKMEKLSYPKIPVEMIISEIEQSSIYQNRLKGGFFALSVASVCCLC